MIKKSIILCISLFLIYTLFIYFLAPKWWTASQHQWQENIVKAQQFLYNKKETFQNIIIGSSLSSRLIMDSIPETYNLSFAGQSIFDGLNIVCNSNKSIKNVFIEINVVDRAENKNFTSSLNSILYYPKKKLISLRDDKQPIAVMGYQFSFRVTEKIIRKIKSFLGLSIKKENKIDNFFSKLLKLEINDYSKPPSQSLLKESFINLKNYVSILEKKNTNIIFFEMPVNQNLTYLSKATTIRNSFYRNFPKSKYKYIKLPDTIKFVTGDGVHLTVEESLIYTSYLKKNMKNLFR